MKPSTIVIVGAIAALGLFVVRKARAAALPPGSFTYTITPGEVPDTYNYTVTPSGEAQFTGIGDVFHPGGIFNL